MRYEERGLIPRALQCLFREFRSRTDVAYSARVSYLEIYNDNGRDLLGNLDEDSSSNGGPIGEEELPKVAVAEAQDGTVLLRGLSSHLVLQEEDALNLLYMGDNNRAVGETRVNLRSSRSHCVFSVVVEAREGDVVRRSKLHLVDLAGSERAHKMGADGKLLLEAKHINTSLHYLELVIMALHEKAEEGRGHIPYRNSMITSVLRDSLGGNCKTVMVATIAPHPAYTEESISTCRFAQRVSLIRNVVTVNEELDPALLIERLQEENSRLRQSTAGTGEETLTQQEMADVAFAVTAFRADPDPEARLPITGAPGKLAARLHFAAQLLRGATVESCDEVETFQAYLAGKERDGVEVYSSLAPSNKTDFMEAHERIHGSLPQLGQAIGHDSLDEEPIVPRAASPPHFGGGGKPMSDHQLFVQAPHGLSSDRKQQGTQPHCTPPAPPVEQQQQGEMAQTAWEKSRAQEVQAQLASRLSAVEERADKEKAEAQKLRQELQRARGQAGILTAQLKEKERQIAALSKCAPAVGVKKSKRKERELMAENASLRSKLKVAEALSIPNSPHTRSTSAKPRPSRGTVPPTGMVAATSSGDHLKEDRAEIPVAKREEEEEEDDEDEGENEEDQDSGQGEDVQAMVAMLQDRHKAFESFMAGYERREEVKLDSEAMAFETKQKHTEAKSHGAAVNSARDGIDEVKRLIENRRAQLNVQAALGGTTDDADPQEADLLERLHRHKTEYPS